MWWYSSRQPMSMTAGRILVLAGSVWCCAAHAQQTADERLRAGLAALSQGLDEQAASLLGGLVAEQPQAECVGRAMCGAGQALVRLGRHAEGLEFFEAALLRQDPSLRPLTLHVASAAAALQAGFHPKAIAHCEAALKEPNAVQAIGAIYPLLVRSLQADGRLADAWTQLERAAGLQEVNERDVAELALSLGLAAVTANEAAVAAEALKWYLDHSTLVQDSPEGLEGLAWAKALTESNPVVAAEALEKLVDEHPQVGSAPQAIVAAAAFRVQAGDKASAAMLLQRLEQQYADTPWRPDQWGAIADTAQAADLPELAARARRTAMGAEGTSPTSAAVAARALLDAAKRDDTAMWTAALGVLARGNDPQAVTRALRGLAEAELIPALDAAVSELVRPADAQHTTIAARAACEYLAATERWKTLAEQANRLQEPNTLDPCATRWIAEGLYQTGQNHTAYRWLRVAQATVEFAGDPETQLRLAELAVQLDTREAASQLLDQAARLATSPALVARTELLRAELEIRQASFDVAKFDTARKLLEGVARRPEVEGLIAARAEWLIGETYFMQGRMEEAIDAYRQVETHPGSQLYRPLALVQAGKCFERLGQWREAAVCYSSAVTQGEDRQAAKVAEERLQAIQDGSRKRR